MSFESHVNPSPIVHHSTPSFTADCRSPTFHSSDLMNWITQTFQPRATARKAVPNAAVDFPFPSPVLTITTDGAFFVARVGARTGTSLSLIAGPPQSVSSNRDHRPARPIH